MGVLQSRLFVGADPAVNEKLEACATGKPNEYSTHFTVNQRGEHIRLVQVALRRASNRNPNWKIPSFEVNGIYSPAFAKAVFAYKAVKGIKNYASKIDDIVGIKTIRSLDADEAEQNVLPLPVFPPDLPTHIPTKAITKRVFTKVDRSGGGQPNTTGEGDSKDILNAIKDLLGGVAEPNYWLGEEDMQKQKIEFIDEDLGVNINTFGDPLLVTTRTTEYVYKYGLKNAWVVVDTNFHVKTDIGIERREHTVTTVPRSEAEKKHVIVPPRPR
jgi:hypothetical protein